MPGYGPPLTPTRTGAQYRIAPLPSDPAGRNSLGDFRGPGHVENNQQPHLANCAAPWVCHHGFAEPFDAFANPCSYFGVMR